jgi:hypothetical protein
MGLLAGCATHPSLQQSPLSTSNAKERIFDKYDKAFLSKVQKRWYDLLGEDRLKEYRGGKVVLSFRLHYNGAITLVEVESNTVHDQESLLCKKAILDPSPYPTWPTDLRQKWGVDYRDIKFTFFYD